MDLSPVGLSVVVVECGCGTVDAWCECDQCDAKPVNGFIVALNTPCCGRIAGLLACTCVSSGLETAGSSA